MTTYSPAAEAYVQSIEAYVQSIGFTPQAIAANFAVGADAAMVMTAYDAALASVTVPAEPITTAAELDALPTGSVVLDKDGDVWQEIAGRWRLAGCQGTQPVAQVIGAPFTLLAPASPPVPAPVLLTDPDDPRIKSGALVSITQSYGDDGESNTYTRRICTTSGWGVLGVRGRIAEGQRALLLAEAPDPDADVRVALNLASRDHLDEMLANLREHGWDVVKVARS